MGERRGREVEIHSTVGLKINKRIPFSLAHKNLLSVSRMFTGWSTLWECFGQINEIKYSRMDQVKFVEDSF